MAQHVVKDTGQDEQGPTGLFVARGGYYWLRFWQSFWPLGITVWGVQD